MDHQKENCIPKCLTVLLLLSPLHIVLLPSQLGVTLVELMHDQVNVRR